MVRWLLADLLVVAALSSGIAAARREAKPFSTRRSPAGSCFRSRRLLGRRSFSSLLLALPLVPLVSGEVPRPVVAEVVVDLLVPVAVVFLQGLVSSAPVLFFSGVALRPLAQQPVGHLVRFVVAVAPVVVQVVVVLLPALVLLALLPVCLPRLWLELLLVLAVVVLVLVPLVVVVVLPPPVVQRRLAQLSRGTLG